MNRGQSKERKETEVMFVVMQLPGSGRPVLHLHKISRKCRVATQEESPVGDLWSSVAKRLWRDLSSQSHALLFRETVVREYRPQT